MRRFDKNRIDAEFCKCFSPPDGIIEPMNAAGVCARNDAKGGIAAAGYGGFELLFHLGERNDFLTFEMAAALGCYLVFNMNSGDSDSFEFPDRAHEIGSVAVSGIGVGDNGNFDSRHHMGSSLYHFRHGYEADVGYSHAARDRAAAQVCGCETGLFDQAGGQAIEASRCD